MMEHIRGFEDTINEIKKKGIDAIYLFGSHAEGKANPMSDIDICVIAKKNISRKTKDEILSNSSRMINLVFFWDLSPVIRFRVFKEGKLLYVNDYLTLHRIKIDTLKFYLDIKPMIRRQCSRILKVI